MGFLEMLQHHLGIGTITIQELSDVFSVYPEVIESWHRGDVVPPVNAEVCITQIIASRLMDKWEPKKKPAKKKIETLNWLDEFVSLLRHIRHDIDSFNLYSTAIHTGISITHIYAWLDGGRIPTWKEYEVVARFLKKKGVEHWCLNL